MDPHHPHPSNDLTRVAQARRRQRVVVQQQQQQYRSSNDPAAPAAVTTVVTAPTTAVAVVGSDRKSPSVPSYYQPTQQQQYGTSDSVSTRTPITTTTTTTKIAMTDDDDEDSTDNNNNNNDNNDLLNQSMEVGDHVESLLANIRNSSSNSSNKSGATRNSSTSSTNQSLRSDMIQRYNNNNNQLEDAAMASTTTTTTKAVVTSTTTAAATVQQQQQQQQAPTKFSARITTTSIDSSRNDSGIHGNARRPRNTNNNNSNTAKNRNPQMQQQQQQQQPPQQSEQRNVTFNVSSSSSSSSPPPIQNSPIIISKPGTVSGGKEAATTTTTTTATTTNTTRNSPPARTSIIDLAPLSISWDAQTLLQHQRPPPSASSSSIPRKSVHVHSNNNDENTKNRHWDTSYIRNHSIIRIQSMAYPMQTIAATGTSVSSGMIDETRTIPTSTTNATLHGNFLQDSIELLQINVVDVVAGGGGSGTILNHQQQQMQELIHYGDIVVLQQWKSKFALTCVDTTNNTHNVDMTTSNANNNRRVHFLPIINTQSASTSQLQKQQQQQWMVLSSSDTISIKVGQAALEEGVMQQRRTKANTMAKIPIQSGDQIVLRNCATGGILSCSTITASTVFDGTLRILTDSTLQPKIDVTSMIMTNDDQPQPQHRMIIDRINANPMTQLHQSNLLVPSIYETFILLHESIPALPVWVHHSTTAKERSTTIAAAVTNTNDQYVPVPISITESYRNTSYLLYPDRFEQMNAVIQSNNLLEPLIRSDGNPIAMSSAMKIESNPSGGNTHNNNDTNHQVSFDTIEKQEQVLILEMINACIGLEGRYIRAIAVSSPSPTHSKTNHHSCDSSTMDDVQFQLYDDISHRWDTIVRRLIEDMLLLPSLFMRIQYFFYQHTPGYEYGIVMQAFCERLGHIIYEYLGTVVQWYQQYTNGIFTLSKFQIQIQSSIRTLSVLYQICQLVCNEKGGALINVIRHHLDTTLDGDTHMEPIFQSLLDATAKPYISRLMDWVEMGIVSDDPFNEFFVEKSNDPNTSWETQYIISHSNIIKGFFATDQLIQQALDAGRYWSAVGYCSCNSATSSSGTRTIQYSSSITSIGAFIQEKYREASKELLRILLVDYNLLNELQMMKRYFLMDHGEFFASFLDYAEEELLKDVTQLSRGKVQHWINNCQYGDEINVFHLKTKTIVDSIRCSFASDGLADYLDKLHAASGGIDTKETWTPMRHTYGGTLTSTKSELTGLDTFYLDVSNVEFPISIVISSSAMGYYHLLFRHLFFIKYVERRMVSVWSDHQTMKELKSIGKLMGPTFLLRQRMLHLLQNLLYYTMFEVIEPNWINMDHSIRSPSTNAEQTVDDVIKHHSQFLHRTVEACMLTNRDVVRALTKLLKTCLLFSEQMKRFMSATKLEEERFTVAAEKHQQIQNNYYARFSTRAASTGSTKQLQVHFRRNRDERVERVQRQSARIEREVSSDAYRRMVSRFDEVFTKNLRDFMININNSDEVYHTHKVNLCIRLDYNGYITNSLGLV